MELKEILELLYKKYPTENEYGTNPCIIIFNDGSGRIIKCAIQNPYAPTNYLYSFCDLEELVLHLRGETE